LLNVLHIICYCRAVAASGEPADHVYTSKRRRVDHDLDDWKDNADDSDDDLVQQDDVQKYLAMKLTDEQTNSFNTVVDGEMVFNIAKFWFDSAIQGQFPLLHRVAIGVLSVPASSASSERVFSTAGRVLEKRRNQLSSSSVDALLFMHSQHHAD
jgi:hypothetical protein